MKQIFLIVALGVALVVVAQQPAPPPTPAQNAPPIAAAPNTPAIAPSAPATLPSTPPAPVPSILDPPNTNVIRLDQPFPPGLTVRSNQIPPGRPFGTNLPPGFTNRFGTNRFGTNFPGVNRGANPIGLNTNVPRAF